MYSIWPQNTAGALVRESESGLSQDLETMLEGLIGDEEWVNDSIDDHADGHLRATLLSPSVTVPVDEGDLALGTWQSILFVECDGPRSRSLSIILNGQDAV